MKNTSTGVNVFFPAQIASVQSLEGWYRSEDERED